MRIDKVLAVLLPADADAEIVVPGRDHDYRPARVQRTMAVFNKTHGTYSEYYDSVPLGPDEKLVEVVVVGG